MNLILISSNELNLSEFQVYSSKQNEPSKENKESSHKQSRL